jgi:hypoxanthine phosphoribosyltransferase
MVISHILLDETTIRDRVRELGERIAADYAGRELTLVGVLKGAVIFLADLSRAISIPHTLEFIQASSYGDQTSSSGRVQLSNDGVGDLTGRHVLLVEDIYDTGRTMGRLLDALRAKNPASLEVCAFLVKDHPRVIETPIRYFGFPIPDIFVVGYGLDHAQKMRNLPHIAALIPRENPAV